MTDSRPTTCKCPSGLPTDLSATDRDRIAARMNTFMGALVEDARRARLAVAVTR